MEEKLDNPVWHSLNETHIDFSMGDEGGKFYHPEYCPFGGFCSFDQFDKGINAYARKTKSFYIVGDIPEYQGKLKIHQNILCDQMVLEKPINIEVNEHITKLTSPSQKRALFDLIQWIQPGYFKEKTSDLGTYFGVIKNNQLVAVAGERMKMHGFTEISAIVTHPKHTRKGYAKQLIKHTTDHIFSKNKIPYLHVVESNVNAIKLYKKIGFSTRRKIGFWNFIKPTSLNTYFLC